MALLGATSGLARDDDRRDAAASRSADTLTASFFGTSTILLDDGADRIMIDAFFSRPPGRKLVGTIRPSEKRIESALNRAGIGWLSAIFPAHAHYDHVMDAPTVAKWTGAYLVGSESTANVARGEDFDERRLRIVSDGARCRFGAFVVTMYETPHGPTPLRTGQFIEEPLRRPAGLRDYKDGENFSFLVEHPQARILIVPSGKLDPATFKGVRADAVFLGIAQLGNGKRSTARAYWREAVADREARLVVPIHWDNLLRPLRQELTPVPAPFDRFGQAMKWLEEFAGDDAAGHAVELVRLRAFERIDLAARVGPADPPPQYDAAPREKRCSGGRRF
jgi:L-ascorbate metabolism protein UlaG (beta-lactamase superfamily)